MLKEPNVLQCGSKRFAKLWVEDVENIEASAREQIISMAQLPHLFKHLAIMPDVHFGKGATVGAVMATDGAVVPNCVGVDIGCGMAAYPTGLKFEGELATREHWRHWLEGVQKAVPVGFACFNDRPDRWEARKSRMGETCAAVEPAELHCFGSMLPAKKFDTMEEMVLRQVGTLGGGNHFLEVQRDESGEIWLMVHSGSRAIGLKIAEHYDRQARALNAQWKSPAPPYLNWLPTDHDAGRKYLADMAWAVDYALASRKEMLRNALGVLGIEFDAGRMINIPHNYAAMENHFGSNVVVHRKGATRARSGEVGIIPGSMGSKSYIVSGKGNKESYTSCSHGAGRAMGRKAALRVLDTTMFAQAIEGTFSTPGKGYLDEAPQAYKDIDHVMAQQTELVDIVHTLSPVITLKSGDDSVD
jgi:tRNA-splicing ligase RtcB (3'-phosphate/5'-hydroxy nucleic acid ligase)